MRYYFFFSSLISLFMFQIAEASPLSLLPIESMAVMGDVGHTQLIIRLPQKTFYSVSSSGDANQILNLTLDNIDPRSTIPPLDLNNSAVQNIQYNMTDDDQLELTMTLAPTADVQGLRMQDGELILDVGIGNIPYLTSKIKNNISSGPYRPLVKTPAPLTPIETAQENYSEAVNLLNQNNTDSAVLLLQSILQQYPDFEAARVTLAETYLSKNKPQEALNILKIKAAQYADIASHAPYYAALAESYRQTGDVKTAADIYQELLKMNPTNAASWAGFGMCLASLNHPKEAHAAYVKADSLGSLPVSLQQYISTQLTKDS